MIRPQHMNRCLVLRASVNPNMASFKWLWEFFNPHKCKILLYMLQLLDVKCPNQPQSLLGHNGQEANNNPRENVTQTDPLQPVNAYFH
ncbi:hypothetical protein N7465_008439 [Penicillium sp. CMV-2018d]|nr:hypothetical protein N7465_008439 [Penicillium sp. CMV-2018d]